MNSTDSRKRKSPSSKARRKPERGSVTRSTSVTAAPHRGALRQEFRAWRASLPTRLERDTLLTPLWVAESVVQEVERFLQADLPPHWARRLATKAHYLYPRHKHFHNGLNRPGWRGLENLRMFMRHWTAGWLKRDRNPLHKKLPYSFGMGRRLAA
jgi:hypothetical protein